MRIWTNEEWSVFFLKHIKAGLLEEQLYFRWVFLFFFLYVCCCSWNVIRKINSWNTFWFIGVTSDYSDRIQPVFSVLTRIIIHHTINATRVNVLPKIAISAFVTRIYAKHAPRNSFNLSWIQIKALRELTMWIMHVIYIIINIIT